MNNADNIRKRRDYNGPAFLSGGFKPFFFGAAAFAIFNIAIWVAFVTGHAPSFISATSAWHSHEMLFGFVAAAVTGFALTAIPNWTGRLPLRGWPLAGLFGVWLLARVLMFCGVSLAPFVDASFFILLTMFTGREVWAGKNWRNLPVILVFAFLAVSNILNHLEQLNTIAFDGAGLRLGVASVVLLLSLIGGRIVPSFTENWFKKTQNPHSATPFNQFDKAVLISTAFIMGTWVVLPTVHVLEFGFLLLGILHLVRLSRWRGWQTSSEPLVLMLHLSYLWLPASFIIMVYEMQSGVSNIAIHAFTTGAMASMIISVMTRATLGHSGQTLKANAITIVLFLAIWFAGITRVISFFMQENYINWLQLSATLWVVGFALFILAYGKYFFAKKKLPSNS